MLESLTNSPFYINAIELESSNATDSPNTTVEQLNENSDNHLQVVLRIRHRIIHVGDHSEIIRIIVGAPDQEEYDIQIPIHTYGKVDKLLDSGTTIKSTTDD